MSNINYNKNITTLDELCIYVQTTNDDLIFNYQNEQGKGVGNGANKQAYVEICSEIIRVYFNIDGVYMIPNGFIPYELVSLLLMGIRAGATLPYHFRPRLILFAVSGATTYEELICYISNTHPSAYSYLSVMENDDQISELTDGEFTTRQDYILSLINGPLESEEYDIAIEMSSLVKSKQYSFLELDERISGKFEYTPDMIKPVFNIDNKWRKKWNKMIDLLDHHEIIKLLMLLRNDLNINGPKIKVSVNNEERIKISVCFLKVTIGEIYFCQSPQVLMDSLLLGNESQMIDYFGNNNNNNNNNNHEPEPMPHYVERFFSRLDNMRPEVQDLDRVIRLCTDNSNITARFNRSDFDN